jgi:crotonobetainyl-CoA:carnitine CoA-transferase CaiB-like acyl-CoA transferase
MFLFGSPVNFRNGGSMPLPLEGTRILEAAHVSAPLHIRLAISMAGKVASELGAKVTILEPEGGDPMRKLPPFLRGSTKRSALFEFLNGAKTVIPADSRLDFREIAAKADAILVDDSVPLPSNVSAVVISTFGPQQLDLREPASELTLMAMSGVLHVIGTQAAQPFRLPGHQPSYAAGLAAFLAMTAALLSPTSKVADVSVLDALLWINWKVIFAPLLKTSTADKTDCEWQAVPAIDGHVALVYLDRDWPSLVVLVGDARLHKEHFATRKARLENLEELMEVLRPWFAMRRKADIYREAQLRGIPLGPVWSISDLLRDSQYLERDFLALTSAGIMPSLPVLWNGRRPRSTDCMHSPSGRPHGV